MQNKKNHFPLFWNIWGRAFFLLIRVKNPNPDIVPLRHSVEWLAMVLRPRWRARQRGHRVQRASVELVSSHRGLGCIDQSSRVSAHCCRFLISLIQSENCLRRLIRTNRYGLLFRSKLYQCDAFLGASSTRNSRLTCVCTWGVLGDWVTKLAQKQRQQLLVSTSGFDTRSELLTQ